MDLKHKNWSLIVGIAVPILMILFVAVAIYLPGLFNKPSFDFIFATNNYYQSSYTVTGGKVIKLPPPATEKSSPYIAPPITEAKLFYYDIKSNKVSEITLEQANKYSLDTNVESADGYEVTNGSYGGDFFPFGGSRDYGVYIKGHGFARKLNIGNGSYYDFKFLGWVKK